jgi:predicted CXXCH cytochrome family protein
MILAMSSAVFGQFTGDGSKATIVGTPHDLRGKFTGATAVCDFCHAPHKFTALTTEPPLLWNVQLKSGPYATYGSAGSSTFNAVGTIRDPSTASGANGAAYMSLLCLSCHDGSISQASFYRITSGMGTGGTADPPQIGISGLTNDHPVDFTYSATLASEDGGLKTPTEGAGVRIPYVGANSFPLFKDQPTDLSGRVECATCHNPHNGTNGKFLRMANSGSALCLNCHST